MSRSGIQPTLTTNIQAEVIISILKQIQEIKLASKLHVMLDCHADNAFYDVVCSFLRETTAEKLKVSFTGQNDLSLQAQRDLSKLYSSDTNASLPTSTTIRLLSQNSALHWTDRIYGYSKILQRLQSSTNSAQTKQSSSLVTNCPSSEDSIEIDNGESVESMSHITYDMFLTLADGASSPSDEKKVGLSPDLQSSAQAAKRIKLASAPL